MTTVYPVNVDSIREAFAKSFVKKPEPPGDLPTVYITKDGVTEAKPYHGWSYSDDRSEITFYLTGSEPYILQPGDVIQFEDKTV